MIKYVCMDCGAERETWDDLLLHLEATRHKGWEKDRDGKKTLWNAQQEEDQPTNKYDTGKLRIDLVPPAIIEAVAEIREYGNNKYKDPDSWKTVEPYRYIAALGRHFCEYLRDPKSVDAESGVSHLKHMACNVAFLLELEHMKGEHNT